jgi:tripartite-type tricarboxylate transporter receptor subunit TctC
MKRNCVYGTIFVFLFIHLVCSQAWSQPAYPAKPIEIIVPFDPGGAGDLCARLLGGYFTKKWGVQINVINKPGGGGVIGTMAALNEKPDGYTMMIDAFSCSSLLAAFYKGDLPFDWRNRSWCSIIFKDVIVYQVRADAPWNTLKEVEEFIKKNPKQLRWGCGSMSGIGTAAGTQFLKAQNIDVSMVNQVLFTGEAPTLTAIAGGHVDFAAQHFATSWQLFEGKKIKPIAVINETRLPLLPDVQTVAEAGYPMLDVTSWIGISGPPKLPKAIVDFWASELEKASKDPAFIELVNNSNRGINYMGPKAMSEYVEKEYQKYVELAKYLNVK